MLLKLQYSQKFVNLSQSVRKISVYLQTERFWIGRANKQIAPTNK